MTSISLTYLNLSRFIDLFERHREEEGDGELKREREREERNGDGDREREKKERGETSHPLVYFSNVCNTEDWARTKPCGSPTTQTLPPLYLQEIVY